MNEYEVKINGFIYDLGELNRRIENAAFEMSNNEEAEQRALYKRQYERLLFKRRDLLGSLKVAISEFLEES